MFDFSIVSKWFDSLLQLTLGLPSWLAITIECVLVGLLIIVGYALLAIALIFMERKFKLERRISVPYGND